MWRADTQGHFVQHRRIRVDANSRIPCTAIYVIVCNHSIALITVLLLISFESPHSMCRYHFIMNARPPMMPCEIASINWAEAALSHLFVTVRSCHCTETLFDNSMSVSAHGKVCCSTTRWSIVWHFVNRQDLSC